MPDDIQNIREVTTKLGDTIQKTTEVSNPQYTTEHNQNVAQRVIWYVAGALMALLAFRFLLSLLNANTANGLANFVYNVSYPFVAPFFSMFRYNNYAYGVSRFEVYTLVAIVFYALIAWGITKLVTINRR